MRNGRLLLLVVTSLLAVSCSQGPETVVAEAAPETIVSEAATSTSVQGSDAVDESPVPEPSETTTSVPNEAEPAPDPPATIDDESVESWEEHPMARVVLTADDMATLGLDSGWEANRADFIELDSASPEDETVCGAPVPIQTSYFVASFENRAIGMELDLNVMPAAGDDTVAVEFLRVLELLATCPSLEAEFAGIEMDVVAIDIAGARDAVVITGVDATSAIEPIGLTLAAAEVDGHLFMAFVGQDGGAPRSGDLELAAKAVELSISRL